MKLKEHLESQYENLFSSISNLIEKEVTKETIFEDYKNYFIKNWALILSNLSNEEAYLFYCVYKKNGFDISSLSNSMREIALSSLSVLVQKGFLVARSSISHVVFSKKIYLFDEIREWINESGGFFELTLFKEKVQNNKHRATDFYIEGLSVDVYQFFYSYGFMCPQQILLQSYSQTLIEYLKKEELLKERLVIEHIVDEETGEKLVSFNCCYELLPKELLIPNYTITQTINYQTRIFNDLSRLCFYIHTNGVNYTKKNEINRKNLDRMIKEIENEYVLWFLIQFLKEKNYLTEIKEDMYKLDESAFNLFHEDILRTYQVLIGSDELLKRVYHIVLSLKEGKFSIADILFELLKKELEIGYSSFCSREIRRKVIRNIEMLHYMGILLKEFTKEEAVLYSVSPFFTDLISKEANTNIEKCISVSSSLQVIVYNNLLDAKTSYIINMFMDVENFSQAHVYQISVKSVHRALYFGFKVETLIKILEEKSKITLDDHIISTINNWANTYKQGIMSDVTVLQAPKPVLDQLQFQPEYVGLIKIRVAPEYAIVSTRLKEKLIISDGSIYLKYQKELEKKD